MSSNDIEFTVFTPTFNRANYLEKVYFSLTRQDHKLFEWLIIDDGSDDNTRQLILKLQKISKFSIRYYYQNNSGKFIAHNRAIKLAYGKLMIFLDSDDLILDGSIKHLYKIWNNENFKKNEIAGFLAHSIDKKNMIVGNKWKEPSKSYFLHYLYFNNLIVGEKMPIYRVDILKQFPFPKCNNEIKFLPEGIVWFEISKTYKIHLIDRAYRYYSQDTAQSLMKTTSKFNSEIYGKKLMNKKLEYFVNIYFKKNVILVSKILINKAILSILYGENIFKDLKKFKLIVIFIYIVLIPLSFFKLYLKK